MLDKINSKLSVLIISIKSLKDSTVSMTKELPAIDFILSKLEEDREHYKED